MKTEEFGNAYVVYSKKLRNKLLDAGFKEIKEPERNIKFPNYLVFFFEKTPALLEFMNKEVKK